jgi:hypothetical protein
MTTPTEIFLLVLLFAAAGVIGVLRQRIHQLESNQ